MKKAPVILLLIFVPVVLTAALLLRRSRPGTAPLRTRIADIVVTKQQEAQIRALVEQLVFADGKAQDQPVFSPGVTNNSEEYRKRFEACQNAFEKLSQFKALAFPILIEHLDDQRQSLNFRNHHMGNSVGHACYWVIYYQLVDQPEDYSEYGFSREGRDGKQHPKPYWEGTPFDDAGGLEKWLERNKELSYPEMQVKCLQWLLEKEVAIGACDADSYFTNILPLEIRILERKQDAGQEVTRELDRLKKILKNKEVREIPRDLLPSR